MVIDARVVEKKEVYLMIRCNDSELAQWNQAVAIIELRAGPTQDGGNNLYAQCFVQKGSQLGQCKYGPYSKFVGNSASQRVDRYQSMELLDHLLNRAGISTPSSRTWDKYFEKIEELYNKMQNNQFRLSYTLNMNSMDLILDSTSLYYDKYCTDFNIGYQVVQVNEPDNTLAGEENDRYSDVETCTDVDVNHIKACGCIPAEVADITSKVYFILRLIGPIVLLIIGGFEMAKAIAAQDESAIEKAKKKLVNKFIAAAAIFLVLTIIKLAVSLVADDISGVYKCIDILLDGYVI